MSPNQEKKPENAADVAQRLARSAADWNRELARRVTRWKRLRLAVAVILMLSGVVAIVLQAVSWLWAVPCFLAAFLAYLLYLDARDHAREVKTRRWRTVTPRVPSPDSTRQSAAEIPH